MDNKDIIISILITYYNQIDYIDTCLQSILNQKTEYTYEIIIGDDGSTDGTYERLLRYQQLYPELISIIRQPRDITQKYEPINRVSSNRLTLLKKARGEYVLFLDGDDYFIDEHKIQMQLEYLEKNKDCDMCGHPVEMIYPKSEFNHIICNYSTKNKKISENLYWSFCWLHADTFIYRNYYKNRILDIGNIDTTFFDDNSITLAFFNNGKILYVPNVMVAYRQIESSSWNSRSDLEKALVNLRVYCNYRRYTTSAIAANCIRHYDSLKVLYSNRKLDLSNKVIDKKLLEDPFIKRTVLFKDASTLQKISYYVQYYIPMHLTVFVKLHKKIVRRYLQK